ncbi:MAG: MerR family transcriptional regulator [Anaerotignum sp.]
MIYTIGEMAKRLGIAPSTLRYYDQEGLLPFVERSSNGIRVFKDADYEWLQIIECLKKTGMQLKDIKKFIHMAMQGDETIDSRLQLIIKQQESVKQQILSLQQTLETLNFKRWYYETAQAAGTTEVVKNMSPEELPETFREVRKRLRGE